MYYTAVLLLWYSEARTLVKHATWCQWRLLLTLDVMPCSSLDMGKCFGGIYCQSQCYSHWRWKVACTEATERSPVDGGCDGTWGISISLPSERLLGRVGIHVEMESEWWPAAEVAYTYHTHHTQVKLGELQKGSVHNRQLFYIYLPHYFVM